MTILIQPLDSRGLPAGQPFPSDWSRFLEANDGFSAPEIAQMETVLNMGSGYLLGGGAAGAFRLKRVETDEGV